MSEEEAHKYAAELAEAVEKLNSKEIDNSDNFSPDKIYIPSK